MYKFWCTVHPLPPFRLENIDIKVNDINYWFTQNLLALVLVMEPRLELDPENPGWIRNPNFDIDCIFWLIFTHLIHPLEFF